MVGYAATATFRITAPRRRRRHADGRQDRDGLVMTWKLKRSEWSEGHRANQGAGRKRRRRRPNRSLPRLEPLEDRWLPSLTQHLLADINHGAASSLPSSVPASDP